VCARKNWDVPEITLYGKPGCCLCDEARTAVQSVAATRDLALTEIDVSLDPELHGRYGELIPVLAIDGVVEFQLRVDADALRDRLDSLEA
jgi:glutaredoxin-like protein DUF836